MGLLYGIKAIQPSAAASKPHIFGHTTARSVANDDLVEWWNGPTVASIKAAIDKDGKIYSAAVSAGDLLYGVAGGIANVRRLDSLAKGTAGQVLRMNAGATAPAWSAASLPDDAAEGDLLYGSATHAWSALAKGTAYQLLQMNAGATAPEWISAPTFAGTSPTLTVKDTAHNLADVAYYAAVQGTSADNFRVWAVGDLNPAAKEVQVYAAAGYTTSIYCDGAEALGFAATSRDASFAGSVNVPSGKVYKVNGTQVVGGQGAAVADATDAPSTQARLNDLLARCRAHGLIAV